MSSFSIFIKLDRKTAIFFKKGSLRISTKKEITIVPLVRDLSVSVSKSNFLRLTFYASCLKTKKKLNSFYSILFTVTKKIENAFFGFFFLFSAQIFLNGVGYKASKVGFETLSLKVRNSHALLIHIPPEIDLCCAKENVLVLTSFSKELLGNFIARLMRCQFPDAYELKGLLVQNMSFFRKKKKKK